MRAIRYDLPGEAEVLYLGETEMPQLQAGEALVRIKATALNRADLLQRKGHYPPPPGASGIIGLELAGEVVTATDKNLLGERVMALLPGGGYAEYAAVPEALLMPIPENLTYEAAAAIPEAFLTAFQALPVLGKLQAGESVLIHAGASGVGTAAIQLAREMDAKDIVVTASAAKQSTCLALGATYAIDYKSVDFAAALLNYTGDQGVDLIVDFVGGPNLNKNLDCLALDGRLVMLALMGGAKAEQANLGPILRKRLQILGSTLRNRSLDYKISLTHDFCDFALERFRSGKLKPVIDRVFDWTEVVAAHRYMEENKNVGKIVLKIS